MPEAAKEAPPPFHAAFRPVGNKVFLLWDHQWSKIFDKNFIYFTKFLVLARLSNYPARAFAFSVPSVLGWGCEAFWISLRSQRQPTKLATARDAVDFR